VGTARAGVAAPPRPSGTCRRPRGHIVGGPQAVSFRAEGIHRLGSRGLVAPYGSLFVSDCGSRLYALHGKGAVWHVRRNDSKPIYVPGADRSNFERGPQTREAASRTLAKDEPGRAFLLTAVN